MKRIVFLIIASLLLFLAACTNENSGEASNGSGNESYKMASVYMTLSSDYWQLHKAGAEAAADDLGISLDVLGPAEETMFEEQVKIVEDQLSAEADALVVAPSLPEAMLPALQQASNQDVPVVLADADIEEFTDKVTFVGVENYEAGKLAGEYISEQLEDGDTVAIIRGQLGAKVHDDRTNGFQDALEEKDIEIVVQDGQSDRVRAVNITEDFLTNDLDIKAIFATNDEMALGAHQGLDNNARTDIPVIGFDGTPDALQAIVDGKLNADVAYDPYQMGYTSIESAYKALEGEEVDDEIFAEVNVVTSETAEEEVEKINGYLGN